MKHIYTAIFSALFILLTISVCRYFIDDTLENKVLFSIRQQDKTETIQIWENDEGKCFVFLPSYAKLENVFLKLNGENCIFLDGQKFFDGKSLENIELSKEYVLSCKNFNDKCSIQFLQSANVTTMYVNTQTFSMDNIYADKNNREKANISLYTSDGSIDYFGGQYGDSIKCRGNATFTADKKPFLIDLEKPNNLLGMAGARKWILLANAFDSTNLFNKIVFDLAKNTNLKWTPDCEYVDLYLNGEYNGLYLLCEKLEVGENRLNIESENGFLCKNEWNIRIDNLKNPFFTMLGRATEITFPITISNLQKNRIMHDVQVMENEILDENNNELSHIDLDSWVDKYLIDEITENIDADFCSSYFYCTYLDGVPTFYAGPIWDYDKVFGNTWGRNVNPKTFLANMEMRFKDYKAYYYPALYKKDCFFNKVIRRYKEFMLPRLETLVETGIFEREIAIAEASNLNRIRWDLNDDNINSLTIKNYLTDRIAFLSSVWIDKVEYHTIQIKIDEIWGFYSIKNGEIINKNDLNIFDLEDSILIDMSTDEEFDFSQPIFEDKVLYAKTKTDSVSEEIAPDTNELNVNIYEQLFHYSKIAILAIFLLIFAILSFISIKNSQGRCGR